MMLGPRIHGLPIGERLKMTQKRHKPFATSAVEGRDWFDYRLPPPESERRRGCVAMKTCLIVFNLFVLFPHLSKIVAFNKGVDYGWTLDQHSKDYKSSLPAVKPNYPGGDLSIGFTREGEDTLMLIDISCKDLTVQRNLRGQFSGVILVQTLPATRGEHRAELAAGRRTA